MEGRGSVVLEMKLKDGWALQSSARIQATGDVLSAAGFFPGDWCSVSVPSTVFGALVTNGVYPDPFWGMNLRSTPGIVEYPIGADSALPDCGGVYNFSNVPMPDDSPYRSSWWYRTEFQLPSDWEGKFLWLHFDGINYRANIWLNTILVAASSEVAGTFRRFEFDITDIATPGGANCLAVEVLAPTPTDLALSFVDYNPAPPDKNMGLWHDVYIRATGPVVLRYPHVVTALDLSTLDKAALTVSAELTNASARPVRGISKGQIGDIGFSQDVALAPSETKRVFFVPDQYPQLNLSHPRLWWPVHMGPQDLCTLDLTFQQDGEISDSQSIRFGIREVSSFFNEQGYLGLMVNGRKVLIRGAGYVPDMMLRTSSERDEVELRYVRDMNLNAVRLEGKLATDGFFELCDQHGIMVLAGWCCCSHWEHWEDWDDEDTTIAVESLISQMQRLRNHPSFVLWANASDRHPPLAVRQAYDRVLDEWDGTRPSVETTSEEPPGPFEDDLPSPLTVATPTGVKHPGPYEYVPPSYWYVDTKMGGAFGFNTETGTGAQIPLLESLRRFLPEDHLWPTDEYWYYHCGGPPFANLKVFTEAMDKSYGPATSVEDYVEKAQLMHYDGLRAMYEAYGRNKYLATGVIHWMLNSAWPSMIWQLYDFHLVPGGAYYGTKKGCELLHVQYSYDDGSIFVVNGTYRNHDALTVKAGVYNLDMEEKYSNSVFLSVGADASARAFTLPPIGDLTTTYFVSLRLEDSGGALVSSNFYWLSTKPDVLDEENVRWYHTPTKSYADFTDLTRLPTVRLNVHSTIEQNGEGNVARVAVENPTEHLAFFISLKVIKGEDGDRVVPVFWEDNYFSLLPGDERKVAARFATADLGGIPPIVRVGGWNIEQGRA